MQMFGTSLKMFLMSTKICSEQVNEHFLDLYATIYPLASQFLNVIRIFLACSHILIQLFLDIIKVCVPDLDPNLFLNVIQICSGVFPILIQYTGICLGVFLIMIPLFF
jgi:hypothetical protein